ncbi:MAG: FUSC family protein [Clostridia bacterium]|nr:FUSC family protein [Clostridia bacterium]
MQKKGDKWVLHIGMRNIKTALATTFTALIYLLAGRNPTFACIGTIFGVGSDMENSKLNGGNRFFGTVFGGIIGMVLFKIYITVYPDAEILRYPASETVKYHPLILLLLAIGVIILILTSITFKWPGAIQPGGVMLCILLFTTPQDNYLVYSISRILDTGIGVLVALIVNFLFPRNKVVGAMEKMNLKKSEEVSE